MIKGDYESQDAALQRPEGKKYVSHFPYPTELNIADTHAYYICSCKHAHVKYFTILNASATDYMLFQTLNERKERRATAIYGKYCCVTLVLLLEVVLKVVCNMSFSESSANLKGWWLSAKKVITTELYRTHKNMTNVIKIIKKITRGGSCGI